LSGDGNSSRKKFNRDCPDVLSAENEYYLAPQQYEAAKKDFEYFVGLIELAVEYRKEG